MVSEVGYWRSLLKLMIGLRLHSAGDELFIQKWLAACGAVMSALAHSLSWPHNRQGGIRQNTVVLWVEHVCRSVKAYTGSCLVMMAFTCLAKSYVCNLFLV